MRYTKYIFDDDDILVEHTDDDLADMFHLLKKIGYYISIDCTIIDNDFLLYNEPCKTYLNIKKVIAISVRYNEIQKILK